MLESYAAVKFLGAVMEKYGLHFAFAVLVLGYYAKAKMDLMRQEGTNREDERARGERAKREEHKAIVSELTASRKDHREFIEAHFKRESEAQGKLISALTDMSSALHEIAEDIKEHRRESRERTSKMFSKMDHIEKMHIRAHPGAYAS